MAETDPTPPSQHPVNVVAGGAAAQSGNGASDTTTARCTLIRIGVFFDGTNNSRDHVGKGKDMDSWHTNVDHLEGIYEGEDRPGAAKPQPVEVNGEIREAKYLKRYMRGIGVEEDGGTTMRGLAWGTGAEGVENRVRQALSDLAQDVRDALWDGAPCDIWFDTFGFSRGATAARDFANGIKDDEFPYKESKLRVKFLGLFDTVSSVGNAGNTGGYEGVSLKTSGNIAEKIVHLTAKDELREYFPLTLATSGPTIEMVGAHSDVGGGYLPGRETRTFRSTRMNDSALKAWYEARWGAAPETDDSYRRTGAGRNKADLFTVTAEHGLQFVALRLMHQHALANHLPFPEQVPDNIRGADVGLSDLLSDYYNQLVNEEVSAETETAVRQRYAHLSLSNELAGNVAPSALPDPKGERTKAIL
ncbi:hypothetical protein BFP70_17785 [Thioclava sp. SK-1]|uniref:phospholipase effector Tle1 domain-containing protein n=1 Tax=Thioclava sp. SK-1 TaxID=1889770 RepID=UPI0008240689|nr:DUF2235 domain-containing protein [Thioclava sp. SK-1]OCX60461.1 hypothetical protein BFP70_17785 [Thioclava sp. SK-1]